MDRISRTEYGVQTQLAATGESAQQRAAPDFAPLRFAKRVSASVRLLTK